jgi:hypothetical protein
MRTLAMPKAAEPWSLTSLREKLIKIGAKVVSHGRYVTFQMAECKSAWNKDPVSGVIGIQSGPPGRRVHNGFHGEHGSPKIRFALDSPLEGDGFELSVPRQKDSVFEAPSQNYQAVLLCRREVSRASDPSWGGRAGRAREGAGFC